jgi:hypothetical protein
MKQKLIDLSLVLQIGVTIHLQLINSFHWNVAIGIAIVVGFPIFNCAWNPSKKETSFRVFVDVNVQWRTLTLSNFSPIASP